MLLTQFITVSNIYRLNCEILRKTITLSHRDYFAVNIKQIHMKITVAQLIERLKVEDPDLEIYFGGLEFYRLKDRGGVLAFDSIKLFMKIMA